MQYHVFSRRCHIRRKRLLLFEGGELENVPKDYTYVKSFKYVKLFKAFIRIHVMCGSMKAKKSELVLKCVSKPAYFSFRGAQLLRNKESKCVNFFGITNYTKWCDAIKQFLCCTLCKVNFRCCTLLFNRHMRLFEMLVFIIRIIWILLAWCKSGTQNLGTLGPGTRTPLKV